MSGGNGMVSNSQVPGARPTWESVVMHCLVLH
jgi:hypothetical protein